MIRRSADGLGGATSGSFSRRFSILFLQVALIRWMPAYVRLLSYFSNFILLACFLGIGVGCLLAPARRSLFVWFPAIQAAVIAAVYFFRLEVAVGAEGSIYFTSGTSDDVLRIETTMIEARRATEGESAATRLRRRVPASVRQAGERPGPPDRRANRAARPRRARESVLIFVSFTFFKCSGVCSRIISS